MYSSSYVQAAYEVIALLQSKLLDYARTRPLSDFSWCTRFAAQFDRLQAAEQHVPVRLSLACEQLRMLILDQIPGSPRKVVSKSRNDYAAKLREAPVPQLHHTLQPTHVKEFRSFGSPADPSYYKKMMSKLLFRERDKVRNAQPSPTRPLAVEDRDFWLTDSDVYVVKGL